MATLTSEHQHNNTTAIQNENILKKPRPRRTEATTLKKGENELENTDSVTEEIIRLKKKIADQDETIDDLDQEPDDLYHEIYRLRLTLAQAWNITLATDAEKVREVASRTRKQTDAVKTKKPYSAVAKTGVISPVNTIDQIENKTNLTKCSSTESTDSGLGRESLTQLIDDRVKLMIDTKLKENKRELCESKTISNQDQIESLPSENVNLWADREQNVVIHGLKEDEVSDAQLVNDVLTAAATQHTPSLMYRLGPKKNGKIRPLMLRMKSKEEKDDFMSNLWMLKKVKTRFKGMSITHDYSLDERNMIKKYVEEAKRRSEANEHTWKVRGTPRGGLWLVKITNQA